jgi:hypothetical protein
MLFRQIVGRALRIHQPEDGTAAQIYVPAFPVMMQFAKRLYAEADAGLCDRRCKVCGNWPCTCPCPACGKYPCECEKPPPPVDPKLLAIDTVPVMDGGHFTDQHVSERYVGHASRIIEENPMLQYANTTQLGFIIKRVLDDPQIDNTQQAAAPEVNPAQDRERIRRRINRYVKRLVYRVYDKNFAEGYTQEIEIPFGEKLTVMMKTWNVEQLREVEARLNKRMAEVFRGY